MSASAQPWKAEGDKDRRTRMVTSSMHAPAKKDGAGGSYTWGSPTETTDFGCVSHTTSDYVAPKVVVGAPVVQAGAPMVSQPLQANVGDAAQFPGLSGAAAAVAVPGQTTWAAAPAAIRAAPPPKVAPAVYVAQKAAPITIQAAPAVTLSEDSSRPGTAGLYDASHPRSAFARKPRASGQVVGTLVAAPGAAQPAATAEAPAVDWTTPGTTGLQTQIIHAAAASPAHLGPYQEAAPSPSLSALRAIPAAAVIPAGTNPKQAAVAQTVHTKQIKGRVLQARGR